MPADYQIDRPRSLVCSRAWGAVNAADFHEHGRRMRADPDFRPEFRQLWDLSGITGNDLTYEDLTGIAEADFFALDSRRALLAPQDVAFGMARMFQTLRATRGDSGIRVMRTLAEARRWLELDGAPAAAAPPGALRNSPRRG